MREYTIEKENLVMRQNSIEHFLQEFRDYDGIRPHIHPAVEVLHVLEGDFRVFVDDNAYILGQGDTVLIRSNAIHRIKTLGAPGNYYVMKFKPELVLDLAPGEQSSAYLLSFALINSNAKTVWRRDEGPEIAAAVDRLRREAEQPRYGSDLAVRICFAEVMLTLLRDIEAAGGAPFGEESVRRIYDAIVYINRHYSEDITAENCSNHVFLSYSYFSRSFKRITGRTFTEYLIATRINHAQKALLSTRKPVSQIAAECGFNNTSYFSALYKKHKGVSPSASREEAVPK